MLLHSCAERAGSEEDCSASGRVRHLSLFHCFSTTMLYLNQALPESFAPILPIFLVGLSIALTVPYGLIDRGPIIAHLQGKFQVTAGDFSITDHEYIPAHLSIIIPDSYRIATIGRQLGILLLPCPVRCAAEGLKEGCSIWRRGQNPDARVLRFNNLFWQIS